MRVPGFADATLRSYAVISAEAGLQSGKELYLTRRVYCFLYIYRQVYIEFIALRIVQEYAMS